MKRALPLLLPLAACIPQVEPPYSAPPPTPTPRMRMVQPLPQERDERPPPERNEPPPRDGDIAVETLPAPRPAWEARPVVADAPAIEAQDYVVAPNDTLGEIAARTGSTADAIAHANALDPGEPLDPGRRLKIPGGRYHVVRQGQTGIAIARAYGVEWSRVVAANGLVEPYILRVGQRVLVPGADRPRSAAERAAAFTLDIDDILTGGEPALAANQAPVKPTLTPKRVLPPTAALAAPPRLVGRFAWPVDGRVVKRFGRGASGERNDGIEIAVPLATPVKATADGVVAYVGDGVAALGGLVIVRHGDGWTSVYARAAKLLVQRGQSVKRGQTLALSGDTGNAARPELHFELRKGRTPVDPLAQLPSG